MDMGNHNHRHPCLFHSCIAIVIASNVDFLLLDSH